VGFNPKKEIIRYRHLWVLLPGCPLALWSLDVFKLIGNTLGKFLQVDLKQFGVFDRRMGKLMVEVDTFAGLPEEIEINWQGTKIQQRLDYAGVPFRCSCCKKTRHLRFQCREEVDQKKLFTAGLPKRTVKDINVEMQDLSD
jgi:hypothetical protein